MCNIYTGNLFWTMACDYLKEGGHLKSGRLTGVQLYNIVYINYVKFYKNIIIQVTFKS